MKGFRTPRLRLLPVVIFTAVLMLSVRLGGLWHDVEHLMESVEVGQSVAQAEGGDAETMKPSRTPPVVRTAPNPQGQPVQVAQAETAAEPEGAAGAGPDAAGNGDVPYGTPGAGTNAFADRGDFTQSEINLLQKLAERRELLETREKELAMREGLLKAAEARIDRKIAELRELEETINGLLKKHDEQEQQKIAQLVKIYATMKPKDAARIFNELDMPILITVMENMKESKSAPILAAMSSEKARALTEELTRRRQLPAVGGEGG